jgi:hypothetical protein
VTVIVAWASVRECHPTPRHISTRPYSAVVTIEQFVEAVLSFLDQFIERGAALDVRDLRINLADDPETSERLRAQLNVQQPTPREGFIAMAAFFEGELERRRVPSSVSNADLVDLVSWTSWSMSGDGDIVTLDPAQWDDWLSSIGRTQNA